MKHVMKLAPVPFEKIKNGTKTIESRLYDEKRRQIKIGDSIEFVRSDDEGNRVTATVLALNRFKNFEGLLSAFPAADFGGDSKNDLIAELRQFYSPEDEEKFGVIGIKISI